MVKSVDSSLVPDSTLTQANCTGKLNESDDFVGNAPRATSGQSSGQPLSVRQRLFQVRQAVAILSLIALLIWRGINAMDYN